VPASKELLSINETQRFNQYGFYLPMDGCTKGLPLDFLKKTMR